MRSYLNLRVMLILSCFIPDRNLVVRAADFRGSSETNMDNPGSVVERPKIRGSSKREVLLNPGPVVVQAPNHKRSETNVLDNRGAVGATKLHVGTEIDVSRYLGPGGDNLKLHAGSEIDVLHNAGLNKAVKHHKSSTTNVLHDLRPAGAPKLRQSPETVDWHNPSPVFEALKLQESPDIDVSHHPGPDKASKSHAKTAFFHDLDPIAEARKLRESTETDVLDGSGSLAGLPKLEETPTTRVLDDPRLVVGVFLQKRGQPEFVAVGIIVAIDAVMTACSPFVEEKRRSGIQMYNVKSIIVVAWLDEEQERSVRSAFCFHDDVWPSVNSAVAMMKLETPFDTETKNFVDIAAITPWKVDMKCKLFYYNISAGKSGPYNLQSFRVVPAPSRDSCSLFVKAQANREPTSSQLCGFPLLPSVTYCYDVLPGSPVFCSGSRLVGLTGLSDFSEVVDRCYFLVDIPNAESLGNRVLVAGEAERRTPRKALLVLSILTFLWCSRFQDSREMGYFLL